VDLGMISVFFKLVKPTNETKEAHTMKNMIVRRLTASIQTFYLTMNGDISLASLPGEDIRPLTKERKERKKEKKR